MKTAVWGQQHGAGGGGGGGGWDNSGGGVNSGGVFNLQEPPFIPKYVSKTIWAETELKNSRELNTRWVLPVYPVFEDENSKIVRRKIGHAKNRIKKDRQD